MQQIEAANTVQGIAREKIMAEIIAERDGQLLAVAEQRDQYAQQIQALQNALQQATTEQVAARKEIEGLKQRMATPDVQCEAAVEAPTQEPVEMLGE